MRCARTPKPPIRHGKLRRVELGSPVVATVPQAVASALDGRLSYVKRLLNDLQSEIDSLRQKQQRILALAIADPSEKDVLEDQITKIRGKTCDLRKMVNEVDNEFNEFARVCESPGEVRIRQNQVDLLRSKLRDLIIRFNDTHADYRSRVSVRVRRQLRAVGENVTEEEADKIINSAGSDELFYREVNPLSVSARAALTDVRRRHNEIVELEKSIQTMQEIFIDLQNLTEVQVIVALCVMVLILILVVTAIILAVVLSNRK
ncbi:hypothetical protein KIN20_016127 [Parelaphostrongylus tenuis]|uniref:Syntaxin N-terminal domain-containing protein n=1 Tax=Parelaphostrongylus tenuis TaxID=148309 RepID=A0AAD5QPI6_PARTN|nr:hypothetical protein KIN20_016127 [Parelaphostrongylus tenuis]